MASILKGQESPKNNAERLQLAQRAYDKALHANSAKLWAEAFLADPNAAESRDPQNRYNGACASALAGCGLGKDESAPDEAAKIGLRGQALAWLQAEVTACSLIVESGPAQARPFVVQTLQHWKVDSDLAGVRDSKALDGLPEGERSAWKDLWAQVDRLIEKASKPKE